MIQICLQCIRGKFCLPACSSSCPSLVYLPSRQSGPLRLRLANCTDIVSPILTKHSMHNTDRRISGNFFTGLGSGLFKMCCRYVNLLFSFTNLIVNHYKMHGYTNICISQLSSILKIHQIITKEVHQCFSIKELPLILVLRFK